LRVKTHLASSFFLGSLCVHSLLLLFPRLSCLSPRTKPQNFV
jgi:hypothetical protein